MKITGTELEVNGVIYVPKSEHKALAKNTEGLQYVIVRSRDAGCHAGYLKKDNDTSVELVNSRRLWFWKGALTLSELAMNGVTNADECKFAQVLPEIKIANYCELIPASDDGRKSIEGVREWKK